MKYKKFTITLLAFVIIPFIVYGITISNIKESSKIKNSHKTKPVSIENLIQYANPIYGTGGDGNTYPGASAPFGMIQWSPDTGPGRKGGYNYIDSTINGFSVDHMNGAGCVYGGDFAFMPLLDNGKLEPPAVFNSFSSTFSHENEEAKPGYYSVKLDNGIKIELTSTLRTGFGRFTFPANSAPIISINAASNVKGVSNSSIQVDPNSKAISGSATAGHFCMKGNVFTIYFYAVFNKPFKSYSVWKDNSILKGERGSEGKTSGAFLIFNPLNNGTVLVKIGISYISVENAKKNLEAENPITEFTSSDFDKAVNKEEKVWNSLLNKIQVSGGTKDEMQTFYSMMYHTLLGPTVCSDVNGQYIGYDGIMHTTKDGRIQYANFSGWDIYRSECQFLALIAPKEAGDMAQSLLIDYQQGGTFPRWGVPNMDSGEMMGDPAGPMIADFYAFGARNFDAKDALKGLVRAATDTTVYAPRSKTYERDALADYIKIGYVPEHQRGGYGNVSMTLEYNSADFAVSQFAKELGDQKDSKLLLRQAQNWKNLYNNNTGFIQMRRRDGSWAPGFKDNTGRYDDDLAYVEGTASQYLWMVPFNIKGLAEKMGGINTAVKRLDKFFTVLNAGVKSEYAYMGNEPCSEAPWIYDFLGYPYKTQEIVRRVITELFSNSPVAYPGNDDLGQMSSWYIFSALGMYPELPGSDVLVIGSPLFPKVVIHLKDGDVQIIGNVAGKDSPYVQSLKVNGKTWNKPWIHYSEISKGGNIVFILSSNPNKKWGSILTSAPPSYN